ncbi:LptF/LptG family permease [Candidatus Poribacteria bacterium]|nr:LptF/LptG family permease [Candidatus Poribacteria bacterium]
MKTLYFYIVRELIPPILISGMFFTFILLIAKLFDFADLLLQAGVSGGVFLRLLLIVFGTLLSLTVPMAFLLGTIIGVGRMTAENEVLAMRAAGISVFRAFLPILVLGGIASAGLMWGNQKGIPRLFHLIDDIRYQIQFDLVTNLKPGRFYGDLGAEGSELTIYYERQIKPKPGEATAALHMQGVNLRLKVDEPASEEEDSATEEGKAGGGTDKADPKSHEFLIFADDGLIEGDLESQELRLKLRGGTVLPLVEGPETGLATSINFGGLQYVMRGSTEDAERIRALAPREMEYGEIVEYLSNPPAESLYRGKRADRKDMRRVWKNYFGARNEFIQRFTLPLACLTFVLISVPLAIEVRPRAKSLAFLIAFLLMLGYYGLLMLGSAIGASGVSWPVAVLGLMLPNLIICAVGGALFYRAMWR